MCIAIMKAAMRNQSARFKERYIRRDYGGYKRESIHHQKDRL